MRFSPRNEANRQRVIPEVGAEPASSQWLLTTLVIMLGSPLQNSFEPSVAPVSNRCRDGFSNRTAAALLQRTDERVFWLCRVYADRAYGYNVVGMRP